MMDSNHDPRSTPSLLGTNLTTREVVRLTLLLCLPPWLLSAALMAAGVAPVPQGALGWLAVLLGGPAVWGAFISAVADGRTLLGRERSPGAEEQRLWRVIQPESAQESSGSPSHVTVNGGQNTTILGDTAGNIEVTYGDVYKVASDLRGDPQAMRQAYLSRVLEQTATLQLAGIDPKATQNAAARSGLALAAVYTALMTQQSAAETGGRDQLDSQRTPRRLSAVELLNREPKLALLGDPGSGKSTFVNFVALCLAGETLGRSDANLALLTTPLPREDEPLQRDQEPQSQAWGHSALLPLRVVLRDFAATGLPPVGQPASGDHLWRFVAAQLGDTLAEFAPHLKQTLREQGGLVLLDGLDEVPEAEERRVQVKQAVTGFASAFPRCRFLVTSRTYAYQRQDWKLPGFVEGMLAPFGWGQIERFVDNWYAHWAEVRGQSAADAQGRAALLKAAVQRSDRLRELAERPLLLTLMASLHAWRGGSLPEKREELYADTVDLLLDQWESPKVVRDATGKPVVQQPSLAEWLRVDRDAVRKLLEELAFEAQRDQPDLVGTADIAEGRLADGLLAVANNPDVRPRRIVEFVCDRAGLLTARGQGVYSFPHRSFQEYLAACRLTRTDFPDEMAQLTLADGDRWREVALLAGAKAARGTVAAAWNLAEALCDQDAPAAPAPAHCLAALLAAQTLVENGALAQVSPRNQPKQERVRRWLLAIVERGLLSPVDRAAAGDALSVLVDERPGVGVRADGVPDIEWCAVAAGAFLMGSVDDSLAFGKETPQHTVSLPAFAISKYLVTNAQYEAFVLDGGYTARRRECWTEAGWRWKGKRSAPNKGGGVFDLPNHPVMGVSWYEAVAFCNWLGEKLGREVRLPSEAEWERAARHTDGRRYPWEGDKLTPDHANYDETGIGTTTAVGIFPLGAAECGALDMSGNAWEWCLTKWRDDYTTLPDDGVEGDITRVVRGGSYGFDARDVRCAVRGWLYPDYRRRGYGFRVVVASP